MNDSIPVKKTNWLIYLLIILCSLLLACAIWLFFSWRIEDAKLKSKDEASYSNGL